MVNQSDFGFIGNIAVSIPGLFFLVYLLDLFYRMELTLPLNEELKTTFFSNESFVTTMFVVVGIALGAYIFLYGLRFYSCLFKQIFPEGMEDKDSDHNFWRHFSISFSFAIFLMLIIEIFFVLFSSFSLLALLFITFLITSLKTFLLHNDIKIKKMSEKQKENWKTFNWDGNVLRKGYYTPMGLTIIAEDLYERIQKLKNQSTQR